uniref:Uncharacterized protein n=1 Tax=Rhizophora mucronata TaxID=61149 RepID=A0A2P2QJS1_RHIMU
MVCLKTLEITEGNFKTFCFELFVFCVFLLKNSLELILILPSFWN